MDRLAIAATLWLCAGIAQADIYTNLAGEVLSGQLVSVTNGLVSIRTEHGMVQIPEDYFWSGRDARVVTHLVAENDESGEVIGSESPAAYAASWAAEVQRLRDLVRISGATVE